MPKNKLITKGWQRGINKYNPQLNTLYSPVKHIEHILKPVACNQNENLDFVELDKELLSGLSWVVNFSEQFYYDNSLLLISKADLDLELLCRTIKLNSYPDTCANKRKLWRDIEVLGKGGFGYVFQVTDAVTDEIFALKYISDNSDNMFLFCRKTLTYLQERNSLIQARSSPFVIQFYNSFQVNELNGIFLLFEYCICDLGDFFEIIAEHNKLDFDKPSKNIYNPAITYLSNKMNYNMEDILTIYIYECFCILDYLASINIVHRDIKPDNIMLSTCYHLKLVDFGLVYNTYFITEYSRIVSVKHNEIDQLHSSIESVLKGTPIYMDIELLYKFLSTFEPEEFDIIHETAEPNFDVYYPDSNPSFLPDVWSMGLVIMQLILLGKPFHYNLSEKILSKHSFKGESVTAIAYQIFYDYSIYKNYFIDTVLQAISLGYFRDLTDLIMSIFQPRNSRITAFLTSKRIRDLKGLLLTDYLDIDQINALPIFKRRNFTSATVLLQNIPRVFGRKFEREKSDEPLENFTELVGVLANEVSGNEEDKKKFNINPSLALNLL